MKQQETDTEYKGFTIKTFYDDNRREYCYIIFLIDENGKWHRKRGMMGYVNTSAALYMAKRYIDEFGSRHLKEDNIKPTFSKPITPMAKNFDKKFNFTMDSQGINLNEVDRYLDEADFKLKKKIFNLAKMEALVFSDPKLTTIYDDMVKNGAEKFGYHYNETILNIMFNDYILNSAKFLQKYKMAVPKKKKRRDKSGINALKKNTEKALANAKNKKLVKESNNMDDVSMNHKIEPSKFERGFDNTLSTISNKTRSLLNKVPDFKNTPDTDEDVPMNHKIEPSKFERSAEKVINKFTPKRPVDETTSAGSAGGDAGYVGYAGPAAWSSKGDLINSDENTGNSNIGGKSVAGVIIKPMWPGGTLVKENYITESSFFEKKLEQINEINLSLNAALRKKYYNPFVDENINDRSKLNDKLINDTNAFTSYTVKNWDKDDATLEDETVNTGKMDNSPRENKIDEKAKSKSQQQLFAIARAIQTNKLKPEDASKEANKIAKTVSKKDVLDFAKTKTDKLPQKIDEDTDQSMISDNPTSMINVTTQSMGNTIENPEKAVSGIERGTTTDTGEMSENELFENIEKELMVFSTHQNKLNKMMEERKSNSQIINDRVTAQNPKNFKNDMKDSGTENIIKLDNFLQTKDDITKIGDNPHNFSEKLEKDELAKTKGSALKNVGNSGNENGDEIPKRNMTTEEQHEVDVYREGLGDYIYENPSEQFENRMKTDMGEREYKLRQDRLKARENREMYHKVSVPVTNKKETEPKYAENISESLITGRYKDLIGKSHIIDFKFQEVILSESVDETWSEIHFDGMGNSYANKLNPDSSKLEINEAIVKVLDCKKYYINEKKQLFAVDNKKTMLSEVDEKKSIKESDEINKIKKLAGYKTNLYVDNRFNKRF